MPSTADKFDYWNPDLTYVIGHRRPDTDAIAAALGYAWFLQQTGQHDIQPARCGQPGEQARYALERFGQGVPPLITDVAPTFHHVMEAREAVAANTPLSVALSRLAKGEQIVPVMGEDRKPLGVVTPAGAVRAYTRFLAGDTTQGEQPVASCSDLLEQVQTFSSRARISDHRNAMLKAEGSEFVLLDDQGRYDGIATQRRLLNPPKARLILVDHNELTQAVTGADEAEIVGVLDHHRLGNPPTAAAIPFTVDPVGSTSTLVAEHCRSRRLTPPRPIAGMLLSGILSDTLVFRSPTTHERDFDAADWLGGVCQIDVLLYGEELLRAASGLSARSTDEIIDGDRKEYEMGGHKVSIAQVETTGMQELDHLKARLLTAMQDRLEREQLSLIALMVTDVVTARSRMLVRGDKSVVDALPFSREGENEFDLEDVVSRKKQLAPAVQNAVESIL